MNLQQTLKELNYEHKKRVSMKTAYSMLLNSKWRWEKHYNFNCSMQNQPHSVPNYAINQMAEAKIKIDILEDLMAEVKLLEDDGIKTIKLN